MLIPNGLALLRQNPLAGIRTFKGVSHRVNVPSLSASIKPLDMRKRDMLVQ
jgi:hypothetical protein